MKYIPSKQRYMVRFFISYLCVWLPLLLISMMMTQYARNNLIEKEEATLRTKLAVVCQDFDEFYTLYNSKGLILSDASELFPKTMTSNEINAYYGIRYLQGVFLYDFYVYDAFMYYGTDDVYSTLGYSGIDVYLSKTLQSENTEELADWIAAGDAGTRIIWNGEKSGYFLLHFPVRTSTYETMVSANYCIPFSSISGLLEKLSDSEPVYVSVTLPNGDAVYYQGKGSLIVPVSGKTVMQDDRLPVLAQISQSATVMGIDINVFYDPSSFYAVAYGTQSLYILLVSVGILLSTLVSVYLSRSRIQSLRQLEAVAGIKELSDTASGKNEYAYIGSIIRYLQQESSALRSSQQIYQGILTQQTLRLIFRNSFRDREQINQVLSICEFQLFEEYYFIGGLLFDQGIDIPDSLWELSQNILCCEMQQKGKQMFLFLMELPNPDYSGSLRMNEAEVLREKCDDRSGDIVCIALSRVYQRVDTASYAYQEVMSILEAQHNGETEIKLWESTESASSSSVSLNQEELDKFIHFVEVRDITSASQSLLLLNKQIAAECSTKEARQYLRFCILQPLIELIQTKFHESTNLLDSILCIDPANGVTFVEKIHRTLRLYLPKEMRENKFQRIIDYIHENYTDCNLTAEQVAEFAGINKAYLSRLFRIKSDMSYIEHLTQLRMGRAKELLRDSRLSISEIVSMVGYIDDSSFRRKFKELCGITTTEYRNKWKNGND